MGMVSWIKKKSKYETEAIELTLDEMKYIKFLVHNRAKREDILEFGNTHIESKMLDGIGRLNSINKVEK